MSFERAETLFDFGSIVDPDAVIASVDSLARVTDRQKWAERPILDIEIGHLVARFTLFEETGSVRLIEAIGRAGNIVDRL
jgi:hypothetical protein